MFMQVGKLTKNHLHFRHTISTFRNAMKSLSKIYQMTFYCKAVLLTNIKRIRMTTTKSNLFW